MAYVREKLTRGRRDFYLVENYREGRKVCQRVLAYLGPCPTLAEAISFFEAEALRCDQLAKRLRETSARIETEQERALPTSRAAIATGLEKRSQAHRDRVAHLRRVETAVPIEEQGKRPKGPGAVVSDLVSLLRQSPAAPEQEADP